MRAGSMFSGIGGLELALEPLGVSCAWQVENDPDASEVLSRWWPDVPNYGDVTTVDWSAVEPVEILLAGFPCQDISQAGRGAGLAGKRSGLWFEVIAAISQLRPRFVFVENVAAIYNRGLPAVLGSLSEIGYDATWGSIRAADVGAPHRRERWFCVATDSQRLPGPERWGPAPRGAAGWWPLGEPQGRGGTPAADPLSPGIDTHGRLRGRDAGGGAGQRGPAVPAGAQVARPEDPQPSGPGAAADRHSDRRQGVQAEHGQDRRVDEQQGHDADRLGGGLLFRLGATPPPADYDWGQFGPAIRRWEHASGRPAPAAHTPGGRLSADFVEWMMGFPEGWTEGMRRTDRLRMLGNAVVPQQGRAAFLALLEQHASADEGMRHASGL